MKNKNRQVCFIVAIVCFFVVLFCKENVFAEEYASIDTPPDFFVDLSYDPSGAMAGIAADPVNVMTSCPTGYTLSIGGNIDNNLYRDGDGTKESISASLGTTLSPLPILNSGEGDNYLNTWGYSLTSSDVSGEFIGLTNEPVPFFSSNTSTPDWGEEILVNYGVSVSDDKATGTYYFSNDGIVTYYLTMDIGCIDFTIQYDSNGGEGVMMEHHEDKNGNHINAGSEVELRSQNYWREGYGFAGWSFVPNAGELISDSDYNNDPVVYGPNETITLMETELYAYANEENVLTLYAVWVPSMFSFSDFQCSQLAYRQVVGVTDERDYNTYAVTNLDDGYCWMIENLRLEFGDYNHDGVAGAVTPWWFQQQREVSFDYKNTNNPGFDDYSLRRSSALQSSESGWCSALGSYVDWSCINGIMFNSTNVSQEHEEPEFPDGYGVYYNWYTSTAGTAGSIYSGETTGDLCPGGWNLPDDNITSGFNVALGGNSAGDNGQTAKNVIGKYLSFPNNYVMAGRHSASQDQISDTGSYARYWTNKANSNTMAYAYGFDSLNLQTTPSATNDKGAGLAIRCMKEQDGKMNFRNIQYDANGGSGEMEGVEFINVDTVRVSNNQFTAPDDHKMFRWWNTKADGSGTIVNENTFLPDTIKSQTAIGETIVLYAIWQDAYNITYVNTKNEQSEVKKIPANGGGTISSPDWVDEVSVIAGWDTDSSGEEVVYRNNDRVVLSADLTIYSVWKTPYTLKYSKNGDPAVIGDMVNGDTAVEHAMVYESKLVDLYAPNYKKQNYGFAGWSLSPTASINDEIIYGPNETIEAPSYEEYGDVATNSITLYPVWVASAGTLQGWTGCATLSPTIYDVNSGKLSPGGVTALTDTRDNNTYAIAKLADENCWMIENMRINNGSLASDTSKSQGFGSGFTDLANSEDSYFSNSTTANSLYSTSIITGSNQGYRFPRYNKNNSNIGGTNYSNVALVPSPDSSTNTSQWYSYGNYYTWAAAMGNISDLTSRSASESAGTSICPAGWELPMYGDSSNNIKNSFYYLNNRMGSNSSATASELFRAYPNNFVLSGYYYNNRPYSRNSNSYYWTKSANNGTRAYALSVSKTSFSSASSGYKYNGDSVRCLIGSGSALYYNANGGTPTPDAAMPQNNTPPYEYIITNDEPTRPHHRFLGWSVSSSATTADYHAGDTYTTTSSSMVLYAVWEEITYTIIFEKNGNDVVGTQAYGYSFNFGKPFSWDSSLYSVNLRANNLKRNGYGFAGWSTDPNVAEHLSESDHRYVFGPMEEFTTSQQNLVDYADSSDYIHLYAVWIPSAGNLQQWAGCSTMTNGEVTALTDTRDNETYAIAKLHDNKCWMIENMRLDPSGKSFNDLNTNHPTADFSSAAPYANSTSAEDWCASATIGCTDRVAYHSDNINRLYLRPSWGSETYGYGVYYNWYTATAGNGVYSTATRTTVRSGDLCPAGWHLPSGGTGSEQAALTQNKSGYAMRKFPINTVLSGGIFDSKSVTQREKWEWLNSATVNVTIESSYNVLISYDGVTLNNASYKSRGIPMRCISSN